LTSRRTSKLCEPSVNYLPGARHRLVYFELAKRRRLPLPTLDAALVNALRAAKLPLITDPSVFPER
jgi:hypothetical protein